MNKSTQHAFATISAAAIPALAKSSQASPAAVRQSGVAWRRVKVVLYVASLLVIAALLLDGLSYYTTPYALRPRHADYGALRPAGSRGLIYGITGSTMMVLMLLYSLRKRFHLVSRWGMLRYWLDAHVYFGIFGPLLILLHTSFKVQGLVAVSFWSMVGVAASGVFGRYVYQQIPRTRRGAELTLDELKSEAAETAAQLHDAFGVSGQSLEEIEHDIEKRFASHGAIRNLVVIVIEDVWHLFGVRTRGRDYRRVPGITPDRALELEVHFDRLVVLKRRALLWDQMQRLFHWWHVLHKPFAAIMYLVMAIHIVVAVWTGYAWM